MVAVAFIATFAPAVVAVPSLHAFCVFIADNAVLFALIQVDNYNYSVYHMFINEYQYTCLPSISTARNNTP